MTVREAILLEMAYPEVFDNMTDQEMVNALAAEVYASHGNEYVVDWYNRLKGYLILQLTNESEMT